MTKPERCNYNGCPEQVTHVVKTTGGFHRRCATCAEEIALAIPERVVAVTALNPTAKPAPKRARRGEFANVAEEAAAVLPGNEFAAAITGLLVATKAAV